MNPYSSIPWTPLYTNRLVLRQLVSKDAEPIFRLRTDEKVNAMIGRIAPEDINGASDFINQTNQRISESQTYYWAITIDDELIGTICLFHFEKDLNQAEIGFEMLPEFRGKGFMQESVNAVSEFAFKEIKLSEIVAVADVSNTNSLHLLKKNGFILSTLKLPYLSSSDTFLSLKNPNSSIKKA
jgi:[ribosomal protein S5]-alanine N-acetyltransferase